MTRISVGTYHVTSHTHHRTRTTHDTHTHTHTHTTRHTCNTHT
jgi:hypothetical protein